MQALNCFPAGEQGRVGALAEGFCLGTAQVVLKCRTHAKNAELEEFVWLYLKVVSW